MPRICSLLVLVLVGCSGKLDSDGDASTAYDAGAGSDATSTNGLAGTWVGYIESFKFGDGSDAVTLTLTDTGSGTTFFGPGPALPTPTNPDLGWPPGGADPHENFAFTNLGPTFAAPRLTFSTASGEIYTQWCNIVPSYPFYNGASDGGCGALMGYACLPNSATQSGNSGCSYMPCDQSTWTPVDCTKLGLCSMGGGVCQCTQTGCTKTLPPAGNVAFDVQLSGNKLDGSVTGLDSQVHNVHLTRQ